MTRIALIVFLSFAALAQNQKPAEDEFNEVKEYKNKIFTIQNGDVRSIAGAIKLLGRGFKGAGISVNEELRTITARDFPENLAAMEDAACERRVARRARASRKTAAGDAALRQLRPHDVDGASHDARQRHPRLRCRRARAPRHDRRAGPPDHVQLQPAQDRVLRPRACHDRHRFLRLLDERADRRRQQRHSVPIRRLQHAGVDPPGREGRDRNDDDARQSIGGCGHGERKLTCEVKRRAGVTNEIGSFLDYLTYERNVSPNTVTAYRDDLESLTAFLCNDYFTMSRDNLDLRRVDHLAVRAYLAHLSRRKLSRASVARHLSAIRTFFKL